MKRKSATEQLENNLIPMINIIFLLLIFFMVAGQITQQSEIDELQLPVSMSKLPAATSKIQIVIKKDLTYLCDGELVRLDDLKAFLRNVVDKKTTISLQVDQAVKAGELDQLLDVFREANMHQVTLLTIAKGEG